MSSDGEGLISFLAGLGLGGQLVDAGKADEEVGGYLCSLLISILPI